MNHEFHQRHEYVLARLQTIPGIEVKPADGTFYLFPSVQNIIDEKGFKNDLEFSEQLLIKQGLALVPGSAFGTEGCIRISFATSIQQLEQAMNRLELFIKNT